MTQTPVDSVAFQHLKEHVARQMVNLHNALNIKQEKNMQVEIDGDQYELIAEKYTCEGCAAECHTSLCTKLNFKYDCAEHNIIWIKRETKLQPKTDFTRLQKLHCAKEILAEFSVADHHTSHFQDWLDYEQLQEKRKSDPDYQKYLELKAKYED